MKNLDGNQLEKSVKKSKNLLIVSMMFLLSTIGLVYFGYKYENKKLPEVVEMNSLISLESKEENVYSYIDVNTKPYLFAVYETDGIEDENKFYLVMDSNNYLYIIYMSDKNFDKLNIETINDNPIRVKGVTKKIETDIKDLAISSYNELMEYEYLNDENFKEYVGLIYLDMETKFYDASLYYIGAFISFLVFLVLIIVYISIWSKNKKVYKKYSPDELARINSEIYNEQNSKYASMKFYLLKDYVVDTSNGIIILKYSDIIWAYPYEYRYNGILVNKNIKIMDNNKKVYDIANTKYLDKEKDRLLQEILFNLKEKNPEIILGFNRENKKLVKEKLKK